jgi:hypothetical protein
MSRFITLVLAFLQIYSVTISVASDVPIDSELSSKYLWESSDMGNYNLTSCSGAPSCGKGVTDRSMVIFKLIFFCPCLR